MVKESIQEYCLGGDNGILYYKCFVEAKKKMEKKNMKYARIYSKNHIIYYIFLIHKDLYLSDELQILINLTDIKSYIISNDYFIFECFKGDRYANTSQCNFTNSLIELYKKQK